MSRLAARAVLDYPFTPPASDGSVVEVAPGILWARMPMPMALDHINVYMLRDVGGWFLVDTGLNTDTCRERWEHIAATHLQGLPILGLICTHTLDGTLTSVNPAAVQSLVREIQRGMT